MLLTYSKLLSTASLGRLSGFELVNSGLDESGAVVVEARVSIPPWPFAVKMAGYLVKLLRITDALSAAAESGCLGLSLIVEASVAESDVG